MRFSKIGFVLVAVMILTLASFRADSKASRASNNLWADAHIDGLPTDIQTALAAQSAACQERRAMHEFSTYLSAGDSKYHFVSLHFEYFACQDRSLICGPEGCLHQVYMSTGGRYRLVYSAKVPEMELIVVDRQPAIGISCGFFGGNCLRVLRWTGARFVTQ
jgi:hypothetical protein